MQQRKRNETMNFIKIPRSLIYDKELGDKRIIVYSSMLFTCWDSKKCNINKLVDDCDYTRKRTLNSIEHQFKEMIKCFSEKNYISVDGKLSTDFSFQIESPKNSFGIVYGFEYRRILDYRLAAKKESKRINHAHLLLLLSYIRLNMDKQSGKPVMHFSMLSTISKNIGISVRSITSALRILEELSIIHSEELPRYRDKNGNWHSNVKIFVNMEHCSLIAANINYDWQEETVRAINNILRSQRDYIGG